jgi:hypothetical protein
MSTATRRQKHGHAATDVLSTAGITDDVERVHASVGCCRRCTVDCLPLCPCDGHNYARVSPDVSQAR